MKALIVDDEKHVREAIRMLVPWQNWNIDTLLEATDGQMAIELIEKERPGLIFTDMMMPVRNGVDLLRWMHDNNVAGKTIVISGYDDFELTRNTIRYGGLDYILKPIEPEELIRAVDSAVAQWRREEEGRQAAVKRGMELNQLKPVYLDKAFSQLIEGTELHGAAAGLEAETGLPPGKPPVRLALLTLEGLHPANLRSFSANEDLFYFAVLNICNEILGKEKSGYAFSYWNGRREVVMVLWSRLGQAHEVMRHVQECCLRTLRTSFHIGLGQVHLFPDGLRQAYAESKKILQQRNLLENDSWVHAIEDGRPGSVVPKGGPHLSDYESRIRLAVFSGQPAEIRRTVHEWTAAAAAAGRITPHQLQIWGSEYAVLRLQWAKDWLSEEELPAELQQPGDAFEVKVEPDGLFSLGSWEERLSGELAEFAKTLHALKQQNGSVIHQIRKYVEDHYRKEISLQDIANQFFLSREYISRKFKQELGENLSDYIGRIRMEHAKKLLGNPSLKIVQIADRVGYPDEKYFSKVFKKHTGQTPNEYRKQQSEAGGC
ncbi:hypothetical protein AWM70_19950 [Paenibacillus yonginensis]|uniref:AraC family transcriptional regulator n=1 Tax=Paenibacillus yonginensis TaxID=1462996 RepID=A0A1B1N566_9BACL|nr:helix-turn-helix domain-containing protein [Paenibacillus yonginensis]ANS76569.1 hypothetical protein AWM70_19950 [Paenibacillus yonginensis]